MPRTAEEWLQYMLDTCTHGESYFGERGACRVCILRGFRGYAGQVGEAVQESGIRRLHAMLEMMKNEFQRSEVELWRIAITAGEEAISHLRALPVETP